MQRLAQRKRARLDIWFMEDIFSTSYDSDYHFLGFSKSELDMDTIRYDDEYKERRH